MAKWASIGLALTGAFYGAPYLMAAAAVLALIHIGDGLAVALGFTGDDA